MAIVGAWANQARADIHIWKFTLKVSINWNAFWFWAPRMYTKHRFTRQSLGKMFSSVHLHPTSSGARLAFRRRTSCGFCLCFQRGNREFDKTIFLVRPQKKSIWKWLQPLTTAVVRRWWESLTLPVHNLCHCRTVVMSLLFAMEYMQWVENWGGIHKTFRKKVRTNKKLRSS